MGGTCFCQITPAYTRRQANVGFLLVQRLRRWANSKPTLDYKISSVIYSVNLWLYILLKLCYYKCVGHVFVESRNHQQKQFIETSPSRLSWIFKVIAMKSYFSSSEVKNKQFFLYWS